MKKAIILFFVFLIIDFALFVILVSSRNESNFVIIFLPAIFLEIAIYGSVIIYDISKKNNNDKKDDDNE